MRPDHAAAPRSLRRILTHAGGVAASLALAGGLIAGLAVPAGQASAQNAAEDRTPEQTLADFIHYVVLARYDVAAGLGDELLALGISDTEFVQLVEGTDQLARFEQALARAARSAELETIAAQLDKKFRDGKLARARHPDEVARNIELLNGNFNQRIYGRQRLVAAGEYAMPQLLDAYLDPDDPALRVEVRKVLIDLGRQAIIPLTTALPNLDPSQQILVVDVLGLIQYRTSIPYLLDVHSTATVGALRTAAARSVERLGGNADAPVAGAYASLAEAYYDERVELTSFAGERTQLLWSYDPALGLIMQEIRTEVFHEAMTMRLAERSLQLDATDPEVAALWIASNYSRVIDTADEFYENPAYDAGLHGPEFFAVAAGPAISQRILRRAIDSSDTPLARDAIAAIEQTAGGLNLVTPGDAGRAPILEALGYPSRRVQYEAALALALSKPAQTFSGAEQVVPTLASMIREASARYAVVLTGDDREEYGRIRTALEDEGFTVLPPAVNGLADIAGPIADAPGIDLMVTSLGSDAMVDAIDAARIDSRMAVTPVLGLLRSEELPAMRRQFDRDALVVVRRNSINRSELEASVELLVEQAAGGPISQEEAASYAARSLAALRDLAVSGNIVLNASDAAVPLIAALSETAGRTRLDVAEVLAHINQQRTQVALMDAAVDADGDEQIALLEKVGDSAKRYGQQIEDRHVRSLFQMADSDDEALATAAAAVLGALGLPNDRFIELIIGERPAQAASFRAGS